MHIRRTYYITLQYWLLEAIVMYTNPEMIYLAR